MANVQLLQQGELYSEGQVIQAQYYGLFSASGSSNNWSITIANVQFTPKKADSKILIMYNGTLYNNNTPSSAGGGARLKRNGSVIQNAQNTDSGGASPYAMYAATLGNMATRLHYQHVDLPNTTSQITYTVEAGAYNGSSVSCSCFGWSVVILEIGV